MVATDVDSDTISREWEWELLYWLLTVSLTVQSDLSLSLPQGVLAHTLVRPVVPAVDVVDGEARVEPVALHLLLGVVPVRPEDHHLLEHPVGDGLELECCETIVGRY